MGRHRPQPVGAGERALLAAHPAGRPRRRPGRRRGGRPAAGRDGGNPAGVAGRHGADVPVRAAGAGSPVPRAGGVCPVRGDGGLPGGRPLVRRRPRAGGRRHRPASPARRPAVAADGRVGVAAGGRRVVGRGPRLVRRRPVGRSARRRVPARPAAGRVVAAGRLPAPAGRHGSVPGRQPAAVRRPHPARRALRRQDGGAGVRPGRRRRHNRPVADRQPGPRGCRRPRDRLSAGGRRGRLGRARAGSGVVVVAAGGRPPSRRARCGHGAGELSGHLQRPGRLALRDVAPQLVPLPRRAATGAGAGGRRRRAAHVPATGTGGGRPDLGSARRPPAARAGRRAVQRPGPGDRSAAGGRGEPPLP